LEDDHCKMYSEAIRRNGRSGNKGKLHAILAPGRVRAVKVQEGSNDQGKVRGESRSNLRPNKSKENISKNISTQGRSKFSANLVNPETIVSLQEELRYLWETHKIDKIYQDHFICGLSGLEPKMHIQILAKEIENLYNEKATIQQLLQSIYKREECINHLKSLINKNSTDIKEQAAIALEDLRMISLLVIENVMKYREQTHTMYQLTEVKEEVIPIMFEGTNYLAQMKVDTAFLGESELSKWFNFSKYSDPFLVTPSTPYMIAKGVSKRKQIEALKHQGKMVALAIPPGLLRKIKEAEAIIMKEPTHNSKSRKSVLPKEDAINVKIQKEELRPLGLNESEVEQFLKRYQTTISPMLIKSYCPLSELLEKAHSGYEPHWLCFTDNSSIKGLAVFHLDPASKVKARVNILHASVTSESDLPNFLKELTNYIWENINCEEIRVGLAHITQDNDKPGPYSPLKVTYQQLNFRWKTLTNDEQGNRILILGLQRSLPFSNPRNLNANKEPITFKNAVILSLGHAFDLDNNGSERAKLPMSQCSYLSAFNGLKLAGYLSDMGTVKFGKESKFHSQTLTKALTQLEELVVLNV